MVKEISTRVELLEKEVKNIKGEIFILYFCIIVLFIAVLIVAI